MQRAQGEAVLFRVRSADVMPLDMRGLKTCGHMPDAQAEAADAAAILVGAQHTLSKSRVASAAPLLSVSGSVRFAFWCRGRPIKFKSQSVGDVLVQSGREVGLKNAGGNRLKQARDMA